MVERGGARGKGEQVSQVMRYSEIDDKSGQITSRAPPVPLHVFQQQQNSATTQFGRACLWVPDLLHLDRIAPFKLLATRSESHTFARRCTPNHSLDHLSRTITITSPGQHTTQLDAYVAEQRGREREREGRSPEYRAL